jgi:ABC-type polysaccharide/polyol phosphate transport system ATPase subunit
MMSKAKIIVMVSHELASLANLCDRVVWLDHGTIRQVGPAKEIIAAYTQSVRGKSPAAA